MDGKVNLQKNVCSVFLEIIPCIFSHKICFDIKEKHWSEFFMEKKYMYVK